MAAKTMVEKAGETIGVGIALAEDLAGAFRSAVTTVTGVLKNAPTQKETKQPVERAARKALPKKAAKKTSTKKVAHTAVEKKIPPKKAAKKTPKTPAKKAGRTPMR